MLGKITRTLLLTAILAGASCLNAGAVYSKPQPKGAASKTPVRTPAASKEPDLLASASILVHAQPGKPRGIEVNGTFCGYNMSRAQIEKIMGKPEGVMDAYNSNFRCKLTTLFYAKHGIDVAFRQDDSSKVMVYGITLAPHNTFKPLKGRVDVPLRGGMSLDQVIAAMGKPSAVSTQRSSPAPLAERGFNYAFHDVEMTHAYYITGMGDSMYVFLNNSLLVFRMRSPEVWMPIECLFATPSATATAK